MAEDAFVTDFEHIMADDITENVRFIMYDSESGKTASAGEVSKYMMRNIHVDTTLTEEGSAAEAKAVGGALATKADTKGRYEDIVAGGAEQLMADGYETDSEPYLFRPTGGSADVGNREYLDKIVGGTVGWNQLVENVGKTTQTINGVTFTALGNGLIRVSGTATADTRYNFNERLDFLKGHVYITVGVPNDASTETHFAYVTGAVTADTIKKYTENDYWGVRITVRSGVTVNNAVYGLMCFDLTAMFNPTIADYIYSLEQATAGAGVAWFRNYFPNDYYPYDPGTLRSVEGVSAHETVGFNQWDEEWEVGSIDPNTGENLSASDRIRSSGYIPVLPNMVYGHNVGMYVYQYDASKNFLPPRSEWKLAYTLTTSPETRYIRFISYSTYGTTYKNDICINISDPTRNGEYEPYQKHTYPLDRSLTLRGVPKLVDGKLAFDGDIYPPSGEVQRRYGVVDLGTLTWRYDSSVPMFYIVLATAKSTATDTSIGNILCAKYQTTYRNNLNQSAVDKVIAINARQYVTVKDTSYTDATAFKAAMSGVMLVYELATPTTETADGYEQYQICDSSGTEEFVTDSIVPVGHETRYPHDLKKKIETAPDSPSADGTYLMKRSGGKNSYMALPSTPSANGAYVLTVTVSGGTASYSWTAKE